MRVCVGFDVTGVYLGQISLLSIGQQGVGHVFRYRPLLPIAWMIVQIIRQRRRKTTNTATATFSAIPASSQSTFVDAQLYSMINRNDKNKQLTLLSQRKLVITGKNIYMAL
jgi:hypothetical protein